MVLALPYLTLGSIPRSEWRKSLPLFGWSKLCTWVWMALSLYLELGGVISVPVSGWRKLVGTRSRPPCSAPLPAQSNKLIFLEADKTQNIVIENCEMYNSNTVYPNQRIYMYL